MVTRIRTARLLAVTSLVTLLLIGGAVLNNILIVVLSKSMSPALIPGDFTIVFPVDPSEVRVGDIIVFWNPRVEKISHRVIKIDNEGDIVYFTTKGDYNQGMWDYERHISSEKVIGKVYARIPFPIMEALIFTLIVTTALPGVYVMYKRIISETRRGAA